MTIVLLTINNDIIIHRYNNRVEYYINNKINNTMSCNNNYYNNSLDITYYN